jgi:K+-transporting ATPase ATPase C chain
MLSEIRPAIVSTVLFTLLLGLGYPLAITGISQVAFPYQAGGSLVTDSAGHVIGSALIAQGFAKDQYLHPRPSAAGNGYDPTSSGGSNYGPLSADLAKRVTGDADALRKSTGLDPDISPAYADLQADRIAKARGVSADAVRKLIADQVESPFLGFIGQPHVNVLMTNRALDASIPKAQPKPA